MKTTRTPYFCNQNLFGGIVSLFFSAFCMLPLFNIAHAEDNGEKTVALNDDGAMIRVPVKAFGETLYFIVDTGLSISMIDAKYKQQLGKEITQITAGSPLTASQALSIYESPELTLGKISLRLNRVACADLTMPKLVSGEACDGMLGMDFFSNRIVSINFDEKTLTLQNGISDNIKKASVAVPIKPFFGHYTADVLLNGKVPVSVMLDTGDSSTLSLNIDDWEKIFSDNQEGIYTATVAGFGNQSMQTKIGKIEKLTAGTADFTNLHAMFIPNRSDASHLGLNFFRRHIITFDFKNQKLYLQPGQRFSSPDKDDMSGLHLLRISGVTTVHSVDNGSPAWKAGVKPNDVIVSVNGQNASSVTMNSLREILQLEDGNKIILQIQRGDAAIQMEFILKKTI